jgi:hypothetical protein
MIAQALRGQCSCRKIWDLRDSGLNGYFPTRKMDIKELDFVLAALGVTDLAGQPATSGERDYDYMTRLDGLLMLAAGERERLGELLQAAERITGSQLEEALAEQRRSGRKLGEILIDRSSLTAAEREVVLEFQRRQAGQSPTAGKFCLGNILVATGQITRQQLADALKWQADRGGRLGTSLVACGHANERQVIHGLSLQRKLIVAVLIAAMSLVSAPAVQNAYAEPHTTKLTVMARVATFFRMQVDHQVAALTITAGDIERGYVEVPAASNFSVITNTQEGYVIDFRPRSDVFRSVLVTGLQSPIEIGAQGGIAAQNVPHGRTTFHQLGYRFLLRPDLQPGSYPWPLEISVRAA